MSYKRSLDAESYYDELAAEYLEQDAFWDNPYDLEIWRLEHELIRPFLDESSPLLDLGSGFYPHVSFAASRDVVAVDISHSSLIVARQFGGDAGRVHLVQCDAQELPFSSRSFGQVLAGGELFNHIDYGRGLREIHRVLDSGGTLLIQFGAKWSLDSLWAILDSQIGNPIGYALRREQGRSFFSADGGDVDVTWEVTPRNRLDVRLISCRRLIKIAKGSGFEIIATYGGNSVSGLVPLPWQQSRSHRIARMVASMLIRVDRIVGKHPPFQQFAGNVFVVCRKRNQNMEAK